MRRTAQATKRFNAPSTTKLASSSFFLIVSLPPSSYPLQIPEVSQGNTILAIYADVHDSDVTVYIDADVTSCIDADVTAYIEGRRLYPTALTILLLGCLRGFWKSFEIGMFVI